MITNNWPAWIIGACLLGFLVDFLLRFLLRQLGLRRTLALAIRQIERLRPATRGARIIDYEQIETQAMTTPRLARVWSEYAKTLYAQREPDELGQMRVVRWRATAPAEAFFSDHAVVDAALDINYYKHLPGILTGMGIIGTFSGLIRGLQNFTPSPNAAAMEGPLSALMMAVGHAFIISGIAIALAIAITFVEKLTVSSLYRKLSRLRQAIDALFEAGGEDEYLERIMKAAETSATQAVQLKDALVSDLRQILIDITTKQMEASVLHTTRVSADLNQAIAGTMAPIAQAVQTVGAGQGQVVHQLLVDVLAGFSAEMRDMFGGQMSATQQLLEATNTAVQSTAGKLELLAASIGHTGKDAAQAMAESFTGAVANMEAQQKKFNQQVAGMVASTTDSMANMRDSADVLNGATGDLARTATRVAEALRLAGGTVESMREAADSLAAASVTTGQVSADYARSRDVFAHMIEELQAVVGDLARTAEQLGELNAPAAARR